MTDPTTTHEATVELADTAERLIAIGRIQHEALMRIARIPIYRGDTRAAQIAAEAIRDVAALILESGESKENG